MSNFIFDMLSRGEPATVSKPLSKKTLGAPGFIVVDGYLQEDEKNPELMGVKQYETYSNLLANVSIISAGTRYFLNLVSNVNWKVNPADDSPEALKYAAIIKANLSSMKTSWPRVVRRSAMYRFYGFSIQEWTATKNKDGVLVMADIAPRPQLTIEQWDTSRTGEVLAVHQRSPQTQDLIEIPRNKTIYIVDDSLNDSPTGLGLFRHIVESAHRLIRYEQLEGFGFESDLRGIPVGRAPFAALQEAVDTGLITAEDKLAAEQPLTNFITNHIKNPALGIMLDSISYESQDEAGTPSNVPQWDIDLLKGSSTSLPDMAKAIERVNREIARTLGVEGLLLGEGTSGSHALSQDKSNNFALIVDSTLDELGEAYNKDYVGRIGDLNGWADDKRPTLEPEAAQHRDAARIAIALKEMAKAGATIEPNDPVINSMRRLLGQPDAPEMTEQQIKDRNAANQASDNKPKANNDGDDDDNSQR